jgi:catechol 2,3-dioxygenase-like lactoylglutathione lyase family enzyme
MFNHISIGVRDIARSRKFYDAALKPLGFKCLSEGADSLGYGEEDVALWIAPVAKPVAIDDKAYLHFCFGAGSRKAVDAFHEGAMKTGGKDNGKPGLRKDYGENYYAAFVIDPDGYRLEAYCGKAK